jgi:hypothetical protein
MIVPVGTGTAMTDAPLDKRFGEPLPPEPAPGRREGAPQLAGRSRSNRLAIGSPRS